MKIAYAACLKAQAILESQQPGLRLHWKIFRRLCDSRKNPGEINLADFLSPIACKG